jgi:tRNA-dihydrouridine synthase
MVARGAGAALMKEPDRIGRIVAAVRGAVALPVTVKTRLGMSPRRANLAEVAQAVEEAGGAAIFVHARFAAQKHDGPPDWEALARVKQECRIPVVGNGGIETAADVWRMTAETGVDGVMIGRGAIGNPWIFEDVWRRGRGEPARLHSLAEHRAVIERHLNRLIALAEQEQAFRRQGSLPAEQAAARQFRGHLFKYLCGLAGWGSARRVLSEIKTRRDVMAMVDGVLDAQREAARLNGGDPQMAPPARSRRGAVRRKNGSEEPAAAGREDGA